MASRAVAVVRRQRLRGADIRNRLVPDAGAVRRLLVGFDRRAAGNLHGRDVSRQLPPAAVHLAAASSAQGLCAARDRHRRHRSAAAFRAAAGRPRVYRVGRLRCRRLSAPRARREHLSPAADARDGRHAAGGCAMGANHAGGRVVAGIFLRGQHRRRGHGHAAGRLLSAARLRHERGHVCGRHVQLRRRRTRIAAGCERRRDSRSERTADP